MTVRYDGVSSAELRVVGGPDAGAGVTSANAYDVLDFYAALPTSVLPQKSVRVSTCLRRSPPGYDNLLGHGYMSSSTAYAGWFAALVDETQPDGYPVGTNELAVASGTIDCRTPQLATPAAAIAGNRVRWGLFNLAWSAVKDSTTPYVPVWAFRITGVRYYLA